MLNNKLLKKMKAKRKLIFNIRKRQLNFLASVIRKEDFEKQIHKGRAEVKGGSGKQHVTPLDSFSK